MQIGNVKLATPLALAPMAGITDLPYRVICRKAGCGLTVSEMVSAKGILYNNEKTLAMLRIAPEERPAALQLFGSVPAELARAAQVAEANGADIIDFNMGCPVAKIVRNGEGSALMKRPRQAYEILKAMVDAVQIPVTVKIRSGWDEDSRNGVEIAKLAEAAGVAAIAVHGRTRVQFYSGQADWSMIAAVKAAVKVPVFGNGDIDSVEAGLRMFKETGCDGLMIGRAADGNPWIFRQLQAALEGKSVPEVTLEERLRMILHHAAKLVVFKGEDMAIREMRTHAAAYVKGLPWAAEQRARFQEARTLPELQKMVKGYAELLGVSL